MSNNQQNPRYPQSSQPIVPQASPYPARPPMAGAPQPHPYGGQFPNHPQAGQQLVPQASPYPARPPMAGAPQPHPYGGQFPNHPQAGQPVASPSQPYPPQVQTSGSPANPAVESTPNTSMSTNVYVNASVSGQRNGIGTAGFVLALLGAFLSWVPFAGWILWVLGAILSVVGLFRTPRGMAIAGTVISFFNLIVLIVILLTVGGIVGMFS